MSICTNLKMDSYIGEKIMQISKKLGGTASEQVEITELCILVDDILRKKERLEAIVLDVVVIEESYECLEEIGENFHEYIDRNREFINEIRTGYNKGKQ